MGRHTKAIILVGNAGVGKSYLCNRFFANCGKSTHFKSSDSIKSVTQELQTGKITYNGDRYTLIDTPGFFDTSDSGSSDGLNFCKLVSTLENCKEIVCIVYVYTDRFSSPHQIWFERIKSLIGKAHKGHIVLLHNKMGPSNPDVRAVNKADIREMLGSNQEYIWFSYHAKEDQVESTMDTLTNFSPFRLAKLEIPEICYKKSRKGSAYEEEIASNTRDEGYMSTRTKDTSHYETRYENEFDGILGILFPIQRPVQVWVRSSTEERVWVPDYVTRRTLVTFVNTYKVRYDGTWDFKKKTEISRREKRE